MRILRVISSMNPSAGGPCQGIRNSIPAMAELGCETEVVSCDDPNADWLGQDPFIIHALGPGKFGYAYSPRLLPWLIENLPRFDAVIIHGLWLWPSIATVVAMRRLETRKLKPEIPSQVSGLGRRSDTESFHSVNSVKKLPRCFVMPHGMLDPYFQRAPERRLKAIRNRFYWKLVEHRVINNADGVLYTCEEEMRLAATTFRPYRPKATINVGYGIAEPPPHTPSMREAFAAACPALGNQPYILFLSRIHPKKGVDMLIRAYARVSNELRVASNESNPSVTQPPATRHPLPATGGALPALVIAGPCHEPEYLRKLKDLSAELTKCSEFDTSHTTTNSSNPEENASVSNDHSVNSVNSVNSVQNRIHFVDMLTGDTKWGALHGCEAFVLPSHQENFGIAVVEALACGKPVLISNKVNIWREIEADGPGLVEDDTAEGTENLLRRFCNELRVTGGESESDAPATRHPSPATPQACYKQRFSIDEAAKNFLDTIRKTTDHTNSHG